MLAKAFSRIFLGWFANTVTSSNSTTAGSNLTNRKDGGSSITNVLNPIQDIFNTTRDGPCVGAIFNWKYPCGSAADPWGESFTVTDAYATGIALSAETIRPWIIRVLSCAWATKAVIWIIAISLHKKPILKVADNDDDCSRTLVKSNSVVVPVPLTSMLL